MVNMRALFIDRIAGNMVNPCLVQCDNCTSTDYNLILSIPIDDHQYRTDCP